MKKLVIVAVALAMAGPLLATELKLPPGKWWEEPRLVERIQLSQDQQGEIHRLVLEHARRMIDLNAEVKRAELDLTESVDRPEINRQQVRVAFAAFQTARQRLEAERFELLLSVRHVLSTGQWQELHVLRRELLRRRAERGSGLPGRPRAGAGERPIRGGRPGG